jgi:putative DNA primase/helicase
MPATYAYAPPKLDPQHLAEWAASGVSETITRLNVRSLDDPGEIKKLLNYEAQRRWKTWDGGPGWAVSGVDPATGLPTPAGAQFKPDTPYLPKRAEPGTKPRKYVNSEGSESSPLFLDLGNPDYWTKIQQDALHPLILTEGAKKAGSLLSQGQAAISIPGVWTAHKKDTCDWKIELAPFFVVGRHVYLAFDGDVVQKPGVFYALDRLGRYLSKAGCVVSILDWYSDHPNAPKGIDDWLASLPEGDRQVALENLMGQAAPFEIWRKDGWQRIKNQKEQQQSGLTTGLPALPQNTQKTFVQEAFEELYAPTGPWICINGDLHRWNGKYYERSPEEVEIAKIARFLENYVVYVEDKKTGEEIPATKFATPYYANQVLAWAKSKTSCDLRNINPAGGLNLANGYLEITWTDRTPRWQLKPHSPKRLFTFCSRAEYRPNADPTACDRMLDCLDPAAREIFLRSIAASLDLATVRRHLGRTIRALLLQGTGSNGKDTLREVTAELYGRTGMASTSFADWMQYDSGRKFPIAKLEGARISWSPENYSSTKLDQLQALKQAITGDTLSFEGKGKDEKEGTSQAIFLFNINDPPQISGALEAIKTRYSIIRFEKTFGDRAIPAMGQLKAEPRFKYDPEWVISSVLPAYLNRVLQALSDLMRDGIDFSSTERAMEETRERTEHLYAFCNDSGLVEAPGHQTYLTEVWSRLQDWYVANGTLVIETSVSGKTDRQWFDQPNPRDKNVKAPNQLPARLQQLFPRVSKGRDSSGYFLSGLAFKDAIDPAPQEPTPQPAPEINTTANGQRRSY